MLEAGADPTVRFKVVAPLDLGTTETFFLTRLHVAAADGDLAMIRLLAAHGADVNADDGQGVLAVVHGHEAAALLLLELGGTPDPPAGQPNCCWSTVRQAQASPSSSAARAARDPLP